MSQEFAPGVHPDSPEDARRVKRNVLETETRAGDRLLYRTTETLVGLESSQPGPQVSQSRGAAASPAGAATVRYEARWDPQTSGVTDQLNSVYFVDVDTG